MEWQPGINEEMGVMLAEIEVEWVMASSNCDAVISGAWAIVTLHDVNHNKPHRLVA